MMSKKLAILLVAVNGWSIPSWAQELIPSRLQESPFARLSDEALWQRIEEMEKRPQAQRLQTPRTTESEARVSIIAGLKAPGSERGVWKGKTLLDRAERQVLQASVSRLPGVRLVSTDDELPIVVLELADVQALMALRKLPFIDYIEPLHFPLTNLQQWPGCDVTIADPNNSTKIEPGDVQPWTFAPEFHDVLNAWRRSPKAGAGVTIGVLDTGIIWEQWQVKMPITSSVGTFIGGWSGGRTVQNVGAVSDYSPWTDCSHGTRMAGLIAAPRDGTSIVGIAWRADLVNVHVTDTVNVGEGNAYWIVEGIKRARERGARIFSMAIGSPYWISSVGDRIAFEYYRTDIPDALFIGAVGSFICFPISLYFPAAMPEVVAVAGVNADRITVASSSCSDQKVEVAGIVDADLETVGRTTAEVVWLGASSGATATIAGIAALTWSEHPELSRDQVRTRLHQSGQGFRDLEIGFGAVNAYKAVGGFAGLSIAGGGTVPPDTSVTLRAAPTGDGPFEFKWSTGETTSSIRVFSGPIGTSRAYSVTVMDTRESISRTASTTVRAAEPRDPCLRLPNGRPHCPR